MSTNEKYEIQRRFFDKGIFQWHFKIKYAILNFLGLNLYSAFAFTLGVLMTVGVIFWLLGHA